MYTASRFVLTTVLMLGLTPMLSADAQQPPTQPPKADSVFAPLTPEQLTQAKREGAALGAKQPGWLGRSAALGLFTAYVGPIILIPIAASWDYMPPDSVRQRLVAKGPVYQAEFERAYRRKVRVKRTWTTVAGSVLGMGALAGLIVLSWDS